MNTPPESLPAGSDSTCEPATLDASPDEPPTNGTIALSAAVFREVKTVLVRPKFARFLNADRREEILSLLAAAAIRIEPMQQVTDCRDARGNGYLERALAAGATFIVSGDADLLVLDPWRGVRILTPAQFLETPA